MSSSWWGVLYLLRVGLAALQRWHDLALESKVLKRAQRQIMQREKAKIEKVQDIRRQYRGNPHHQPDVLRHDDGHKRD